MEDEFGVELLGVRRYRAGYEVHTKRLTVLPGCPAAGESVIIKWAYTAPEHHFIGSPRDAHRLIVKQGIKPEPLNPADRSANGGAGTTCRIGFCARNQKWYGWSHRQICGFTIGSEVHKGDCVAASGRTLEYLAEHPGSDLSLPVGFVAQTLDDAKRMAIAFAGSVG